MNGKFNYVFFSYFQRDRVREGRHEQHDRRRQRDQHSPIDLHFGFT